MNRTSDLPRGKPLVRRTRLRSGAPLPAKSRKQRRIDARWAGVRVTVLERDGGICQRCGRQAHEVHHKAGRVGADMWNVDLLVSLCRECHGAVHDSPEQARAEGWSVRRLRSAA